MIDHTLYENAHRSAFRNRKYFSTVGPCGCFYCGAHYPSTAVKTWVDSEEQTALCPKCGIDAVIHADSGFPITSTFLDALHFLYFGKPIGASKEKQWKQSKD